MQEGSELPELKIAQIKDGMRGITVTGEVVFKGDQRKVETRYGPAMVSWVVLEDQTGSIRLNLWRQQIDMARVGDTIKLVNAFVRVYRDEMELNIGSDGRMEVRAKVLESASKGMSARQIAERTTVGKSTAANIIKEARQNGSLTFTSDKRKSQEPKGDQMTLDSRLENLLPCMHESSCQVQNMVRKQNTHLGNNRATSGDHSSASTSQPL